MKDKMNCVIVDDDDFAIDVIKDYMDDLPHLHLLKSYTRPLEALSEIPSKVRPDIIFMNVQMPGITGIQLAEALKEGPYHIIFVTGHSEHYMQCLGISAEECLLKPFSSKRFIELVMKITSNFKVF
jgi:two-component SAPR family response regulator